MVVEDAEQGGTLLFEDEAEAGDFSFPPRTSGSLEETWRIEPHQLKCRRKANGQLWKLGQGKVTSAEMQCKFAVKAIAK